MYRQRHKPAVWGALLGVLAAVLLALLVGTNQTAQAQTPDAQSSVVAQPHGK